VKQALAAGKHVVCGKPLALTAAESRELVELADAAGVVHCTNFMARFYPLVQQARSLLNEGSLGEIWNVHGSYLQDWHRAPAWNWRLEPERGGELRAIGDIGSHWLDLIQFVTGSRIVEVFADLQTVIPIRRRPVGPVQTFAQTEAEGEDVTILAALYAVGYDHVVSIEHEDRAFEGDDELVKRGFLIARNALRPYIA
jgi:predicted dehydrogenase